MSNTSERYPAPWTFRMAPEMLRRLTETAEREGMPMSEIVRRGIETELNRLDARHERESQG